MKWEGVEQSPPRLAATARRRMIEPGVVLVGTLRRDGTPRISPVEPFIMDGDLLLSTLWHSRKAADLARDARILVHSIVTSRHDVDGEVTLRGRARRKDRPEFARRGTSATTLGRAGAVRRSPDTRVTNGRLPARQRY